MSIPNVHLAHFKRYLWSGPSLLVVLGESRPLLDGLLAYNARYEIPLPSPAEERHLRAMLGACGTAALSLAERESWGWSLALPDGRGCFVGVEPEGMMVIHPKANPEHHAQAVVQRQKPQAALTQSYFSPKSADPLRVVEHYFDQVQQTATRLAENETGRIALITALPNGSLGSLSALADEALVAELSLLAERGGLQELGEVLLFYECRCDDAMILDMLASLPEAQRKEVWGEERTLSIECPRCGRLYTVERKNVVI